MTTRQMPRNESFTIPFVYGNKFKFDCWPKYYQVFDSYNWEGQLRLQENVVNSDIAQMVGLLASKEQQLFVQEKYDIIKKENKQRNESLSY